MIPYLGKKGILSEGGLNLIWLFAMSYVGWGWMRGGI